MMLNFKTEFEKIFKRMQEEIYTTRKEDFSFSPYEREIKELMIQYLKQKAKDWGIISIEIETFETKDEIFDELSNLFRVDFDLKFIFNTKRSKLTVDTEPDEPFYFPHGIEKMNKNTAYTTISVSTILKYSFFTPPPCSHCDGHGVVWDEKQNEPTECPVCFGTGEKEVDEE